MKQIDVSVTNITPCSVAFEIKGQNTYTNYSYTLKSNDTCKLLLQNTEYDLYISKINNVSVNKYFKVWVTSDMGFMQENYTNEIYINDFINNKIYKEVKKNFENLYKSNIYYDDEEVAESGNPGEPNQSFMTYGNYTTQSQTLNKSNYPSYNSYGANGYGTNFAQSSTTPITTGNISYGMNTINTNSINRPSNFSNYTSNTINSTSLYTQNLNSNIPSGLNTQYTNISSSIGNSNSTNSGYLYSGNLKNLNSYGAGYSENSSSFSNVGYVNSSTSKSSTNQGLGYSVSTTNSTISAYGISGVTTSSNYTGNVNSEMNSYIRNTMTSPMNGYSTNNNVIANDINSSSVLKTDIYKTSTITQPTSFSNYNYSQLINNNPTNTTIIKSYANTSYGSTNPSYANNQTIDLNKKEISVIVNNNEGAIQSLNVNSNLLKKYSIETTDMDFFGINSFADLGAFVAKYSNIDMDFICKEIIKNKKNVFNQLHRNEISTKMQNRYDYVELNEIKISNKSKNNVFIRMSGKEKKDSITLIATECENVWIKEPNSIYKIEICGAKGSRGPVYNVKAGCKYKINKNNIFIDAGKNTILSCSGNFDPLFILENQFGVFYKKQDNIMHKLINSERDIMVVNRGNNDIHIKIDGDSASNFEDFIELEPLTYLIFKRKPGSYYTQFSKKNNLVAAKYLLKAGNVYCFNEDETGFLNDKTGEKVDSTDINYDFKVQNTKISGIKSELKDKWRKIEEILNNHPNKYKIKDFNLLLFRFIEITNNSSNEIYVRIISKKIGSEQFLLLKPFEKKTWKRLDGTYLTELVDKDLKSKRFCLKTDVAYTLDQTGVLQDGSTKLPVKLEKAMFSSDELIYFNPETKEYLRKKIIYDESDVQKTTDLISVNQNRRTEAISQEDYEYFEGIKPNYIRGTQFTDQNFPPNEFSLKAINPKTGTKIKQHFKHSQKTLSDATIKGIEWKRPKDAFEKQYYLFKDEICYDDVKQGSIGDCYLMSVLAALSQRPDLIKAAFKTQTVNPDGFYELFFYENGKKKIMFIDDSLVLTKSKYLTNFEFAKPNGEELWVMLLEKAYAKYEGGYSNIIGGLMYPELKWLTGAHTRELKNRDPQCWKEILSACIAKHIVVAGSVTGSGDHFKKSEKGISNGHAYTILDAKEYNRSVGNGIKLLKMRNPWGHTEWKGDYSDKSKLWTPELKTYFGFVESSKEDGVFFMPFEEYIKEFKNVIICAVDTRN